MKREKIIILQIIIRRGEGKFFFPYFFRDAILGNHIFSGMHTFGQIIFLQGQLFSCFYQNNGFSITIRDWFPLSILISLCLYTSVHRCILRTKDLALVQQRELTVQKFRILRVYAGIFSFASRR